jgi:hypothetical protein
MHWDGLPCGEQDRYYRDRILNVARASAWLGVSPDLANKFSELLKPRMLYKDLPVNKEGKWVDVGTDDNPLPAGYMTPDKWTQRMWRITSKQNLHIFTPYSQTTPSPSLSLMNS